MIELHGFGLRGFDYKILPQNVPSFTFSARNYFLRKNVNDDQLSLKMPKNQKYDYLGYFTGGKLPEKLFFDLSTKYVGIFGI